MLYSLSPRADTSSVDAPQLKSAWLLPPVIVGLYLLHTVWSWALAGGIAFVVGTLVALDYRGVATRIPWVLGRTPHPVGVEPECRRKTSNIRRHRRVG